MNPVVQSVSVGHEFKNGSIKSQKCLGWCRKRLILINLIPVKSIVINQAGYYGLPRKLALQRTEHCLKQMDLWDKRDTVSRRLSGGMKRRVMIARCHGACAQVVDS